MPPEANAKARQPSAISQKPDSKKPDSHRPDSKKQTAKSPGCRNIPGFRSYLKSDAQQSASVDVS